MKALRMECPSGIETFTEKQWMAAVQEVAAHCKWFSVHFPNMIGNKRGWPDLLLLKDDRYLLIELKSLRGDWRPAQLELAKEMGWYGVWVYTLRPTPEDWDTMMDLLR